MQHYFLSNFSGKASGCCTVPTWNATFLKVSSVEGFLHLSSSMAQGLGWASSWQRWFSHPWCVAVRMMESLCSRDPEWMEKRNGSQTSNFLDSLRILVSPQPPSYQCICHLQLAVFMIMTLQMGVFEEPMIFTVQSGESYSDRRGGILVVSQWSSLHDTRGEDRVKVRSLVTSLQYHTRQFMKYAKIFEKFENLKQQLPWQGPCVIS